MRGPRKTQSSHRREERGEGTEHLAGILRDTGLCCIESSLKTLVRVSTEEKHRKSVTELGRSGDWKLRCVHL